MFDLAGRKGLGRKGATSKNLTREEEAVSACGKDDRVGILHAAGRVLYPKCKSVYFSCQKIMLF